MFLVIILATAAYGAVAATQHPSLDSPSARISAYVSVLVMQIVMFLFIRAGVRKAGVPLRDLFGPRTSVPVVLLDIVIAASFWAVTRPLSETLHRWLHAPDTTSGLLPRGFVESAIWVALSITAGIVEELTFRGYAQRQFAAFTGSRTAAVALQALVFAVGHAYQGWRSVLVIVAIGLCFGIVAATTRRLRPGIIAHAAMDITGGLWRM